MDDGKTAPPSAAWVGYPYTGLIFITRSRKSRCASKHLSEFIDCYNPANRHKRK